MEHAAQKKAVKPGTILLVEDEAIIALSEKTFLEQNNFEVHIAASGEAAVAFAAEARQLDLILMDIDLGKGINGAEAARRILRKHDLPIVFLSSHTEPEVVESTEAISSYGYIVKNSGNTVLLASIKMALKLFHSHKREQKKQETLQQYEATLCHQAELHKLLIEIAGLYINLPSQDLQAYIDNSLARIGEFTETDRVYVFDFDYEKNIAINTYEWCAPGVPPQISRLQAIPLASINEAMSLHRRGLPLHLDDVSRLPRGPLWSTLSEQGIQSILVVPMMESGKCIGSIGFDVVRRKHKFISEEIELLTVFTQLLVNVRQRRHKEQVLRLSEEKFSAIFHASQNLISLSDLETGLFIEVNPTFCEKLGYRQEDVIGRKPLEITRLEKVYTEELRRRLLAGQIIRNEEAVLRTLDNKTLHVLLSGSIIQIANRRYILSVAVDISSRRAMEQDLQRRMREQEIILRETHHRIKNNIASIRSLLSIQANMTTSAEASQVLQEAMSRVDSMYSLYAHMVNTDEYQDMEAGLYLGQLCDSLLTLFSGKRGQAAIKLEKDFEAVRISSGRLSKIGIIVNELLTNALKYAFDGRVAGCISISLHLSNDIIELKVSDDGKGLPPDSSTRTGQGFGLMLVHLLCEQLDATLEQQNHSGTSYVLRLTADENKEKS